MRIANKADNPAGQRVLALHLGVLIFYALLFLFITGCERQEETAGAPSTETPTAATNTYMIESVFDQVLRQTMANPEDAGAWYHLADLYFRGNEYERAVEAYQKSVDLKPDKGYAYGKMGAALSRLNRPDEAAAALEQAVALLPNPAVEYNNLGIVYGKLGRHEDEIKALQKAIELRPRYATARLNLGVTYLKIGNIDAAKAQHEIVKGLDAQTADLLLKEINKHATNSPGTP